MNEIEKKFFETFEIEQEKNCYYWDCPHSTGNVVDDLSYCDTCENPISTSYPEITDRILLELYVIYSYFPSIILQVGFDDVEDLKKHLLSTFISDGKAFKREVQALFKKG